MHICDNPICVNPDHLLQSTQKQNIIDAISKGRMVFKKGNKYKRGPSPLKGKKRKLCKRGHDISTDNKVYLSPSSGRICLRCRKMMTDLYKKKLVIK